MFYFKNNNDEFKIKYFIKIIHDWSIYFSYAIILCIPNKFKTRLNTEISFIIDKIHSFMLVRIRIKLL